MSGTQSPRSARYARAARFALPLVLASGGLTALALGIGEPQTGGTPRMEPRSQAAADPPRGFPTVRAYRTASCGCCSGWVAHLRSEGFSVEDHVVEELAPIRRSTAVPPDLGSCHTAVVAGYAIEGHVPAGAIRRLLQERPALAGIAVPGMPLGSPGMESSLASESYTVFGFRRDGSRRPFLRVEA